jgi:hypothetical protein
MLFVGVADLWARHDSVRQLVRSGLPPLCAVLVPTGLLLGLYYLQNHAAIELIAHTVYPGHRRDTGGVADLYQWLSAPYGTEIALRGSTLPGTNQSEISSFLILAPYACLQLLRLRLAQFSRLQRAQLVGTLGAFALIGLWYFTGLPSIISIPTGLDRVPASRSIIGLGMASLLFVAILSVGVSGQAGRFGDEVRFMRHNRRPADPLVGAAIAASVAFAVTYWSGRVFNAIFPGLHIGSHTALFWSLAVGICTFLVTAGRPLLGGSCLAALGMAISLPANPLYRGLAPYTSSDSTTVLTSVPGASSQAWLAFTGPPLSDVLIASGLRTVNAVSFYPDPSAWAILDPAGTQTATWNRYANLSFVPQPGLSTATLTLQAPDVIRINVDPCGDQLTRLGVGFVLSPSPLSGGCLNEVKQTELLGVPAYIYRIG